MKKRYEINMTKGPLLPELLQFILPLMLSVHAADRVQRRRPHRRRPVRTAALHGGGRRERRDDQSDHQCAHGSCHGRRRALRAVLRREPDRQAAPHRVHNAHHRRDRRRDHRRSRTCAHGAAAAGSSGAARNEVLRFATVYLRIYFLGLPVMALYNFSAARCARSATRASRSSISPSPVC